MEVLLPGTVSDYHKSTQAEVAYKETEYTTPYRGNLVKVANKLKEQGILKSRKEGRSNSYYVSEYGIYYLLYQKDNVFEPAIVYLLSKNSKNIIFESFLVPIFLHTTLEYLNLHGDAVCRYLRRCFQEIKLYQQNMNFELTYKVFEWGQIPPERRFKLSEIHDCNLQNFLQSELNLSWVKYGTAEKLSNLAIRISHKNKSLIIRISEDNKSATLYSNGERLYRFHVSYHITQVGGREIKRQYILATHKSPRSFALNYLTKGIEMNIENLLDDLLSGPLNYSEKMKLAGDTKFCRLIKELRRSFETKVDTLNQLEKHYKK